MTMAGSGRPEPSSSTGDEIRLVSLDQAIRVKTSADTPDTILAAAKKFEEYLLNGGASNGE